MMKLKIFAALSVALMMAGCAQKQPSAPQKAAENAVETAVVEQAEKAETTDTVREVTDRLVAIYDEVCKTYNEHFDDDTLSFDDEFNERFLSESYQTLYAQMRKESAEYPNELMGFDFDHWCLGQDWGCLAYDITDVAVNGGLVLAQVDIHSGEETSTVVLPMVRQDDGEWYIDDFRCFGNYSDRQRMTDCIRECRAEAEAAVTQ
ncbi:MAG: hypothetical protein IJ196_04185 [Prevotella sp.]|nr:hypothetical protein [Prevotella sp.]